jgi:hypothetical protein
MILLTQDMTCSGDRYVCFTILFNNHYGTNYTYEETRQLYLDHCDFVLNICPLEEPVFTCELLQHALNNFNKEYPGGGAALGQDCQQFQLTGLIK